MKFLKEKKVFFWKTDIVTLFIPAVGVEVAPVADEVVAARVGENADDLGGGGGDARLVSAHCTE